MDKKKAATFRLSIETIKQINTLAERNKVSQADVISVLVHCATKSDCIDEDALCEMFDIIRLG
jgi:hypothetical protein